MEIQIQSNVVNIRGNIKTMQDYQQIKESLDTLSKTQKTIIINMLDSISITSSVIGYLNKLVLKDKINLSINVSSSTLKELFDDLNLTSLFHVRKV
jgi:hypothetical protein